MSSCGLYCERPMLTVLTQRRGESLLLELRPDPFRRNGAIRACCHGQEDGEFFAAITISEIRLAQAPFDHLTEWQQDGVSLDMAISVVGCLEIVESKQEKSERLFISVRPV